MTTTITTITANPTIAAPVSIPLTTAVATTTTIAPITYYGLGHWRVWELIVECLYSR